MLPLLTLALQNAPVNPLIDVPINHPAHYLIPLALGVLVGAGATMLYHRAQYLDARKSSTARWPRDWPKPDAIFSKNEIDKGYLALTARTGMRSGAFRMGRVYPRSAIVRFLLWLIPNKYPLYYVKEWLLRAGTKEVWIPLEKRYQHLSVLGATGKGKSTKFVINQIAYGALEENSSYYAIDVKTPQFCRMFSRLYKEAGKAVQFIDPWSIDETMAFEPLWRADGEVQKKLSEVITTYSKTGQDVQASGNSQFFEDQAAKTMEALLALASYWPRRFCSLPCVQQLVFAGGKSIVAALENAVSQMPSLEQVREAAEAIIPMSEEDLRSVPRKPEVEQALKVLDRSGYNVARLVKGMRKFYRDVQGGRMSRQAFEQKEQLFWMNLETEMIRRRQDLELLVQNQGEFIQMPDDTRNSVLSTLSNKVNPFRDPALARVFSRDELRVELLCEKPSLLIVGSPMAKREVGSMFVASILTNLAMTSVFARGMLIEKGDPDVSKHGVFFMLDEFPQLNIRNAGSAAATFRGFKSGLIFIYQDRGQLKKLYGEGMMEIEANCVHKVMLDGSHEDTAEFYSKAIGEVPIVKRSESGASGEKKSISTSVEKVQLMSPNDMGHMKINGKAIPNLALSIGRETEAFPFYPVPYYDDPDLRKLLRMKRTLKKKGPFWNWTERWEPSYSADDKFIHRRPYPRGTTFRDLDPYEQYLDFLIGRPREKVVRDGREVIETIYPELLPPVLELAEVGAAVEAKGAQKPGPRPGAPQAAAATQAPQAPVVHTYGVDFRVLVNEDFMEPPAITAVPAPGGTFQDRIAAGANPSEEN